MPLPTRQITAAERHALELRYDGPIPKEMLGPFLDLPATHEGCQALLVDLCAELDEARKQPRNDVPVAILQRDMATVRMHMAALPQLAQAAE